jgi:hypothetical protein
MKKLVLLFVVVSFSSLAFAGSETINFEQYAEYTQITNQYSNLGVTFTNALQLVAPGYDYFDFPPHSGNGLITDDPGSTISMFFAPGSAGLNVTGWFNAPAGMTVTAYNSLNQVIATFNGTTIPGTDQMFSLNANTYISYITFTDLGGGDDITLDDLTWSEIPEPSTPMMMTSGLLAFGLLWRRKLSLFRKSAS